ncbi:MAG: hypothetical protein L7F78_17105, partial [Syntrophales bacterium LBB04]|nr:hypothetical protein [Syntrophales bacterium LBB04]
MAIEDKIRGLIRPVINLGVTERARPENVKHIQLLNTAAIFELVLFSLGLFGALLQSLGPDAGGLLKGFYINHIPVSLAIMAMLAALILSKTGRHSTGAMLFVTTVVFFQSCMT